MHVRVKKYAIIKQTKINKQAKLGPIKQGFPSGVVILL
jgi:hypothetical protein